MRAIDADVLFREMEKAQWYNNADRDEIAEELVLNAPTIEPRCEACEAFNKTRLLIPQPERTGRWKGYNADNPKWQRNEGSWDRFEAWEKLSQVYQMKGLPDLAYSIIGDVMRFLDVPDAEEPKKCDTCRHEKSQWFNRCADCFDYELWESKE